MYKVSICIPTFNRCSYLRNCLNSIILNKNYNKEHIQICVSDNCSTDETEAVVNNAQKEIEIVYKKNKKNLGMTRNFINVIDMADGEYIWLIGDDDLLVTNAFEKLIEVIEKNQEVDFFYINTSHLKSEYVFNRRQPFDTKELPKNMQRFSSWESDGKIDFLDLINPRVSFDFLGGIFLSVFKREKWVKNLHVLDRDAVCDDKVYSHFDNTFPHVKIFAKAFSGSTAYFYSKPLSVSLSGAREWSPMLPFVRSVRLIESLDEYYENGLPYIKYIQCKNFALRTFIPDMVYTIVNRKNSGYEHVQLLKLLVNNALYPEFYLSFFRYFFRKFKQKYITYFRKY